MMRSEPPHPLAKEGIGYSSEIYKEDLMSLMLRSASAFSRRLSNLENIGTIQFLVATEKLFDANPGKIYVTSVFLNNTQRLSTEQTMSLLKPILGEPSAYIYDVTPVFWVGCNFTSFLLFDSNRDREVYRLTVYFATADIELYKRFSSVLSKSGFHPTDEYQKEIGINFAFPGINGVKYRFKTFEAIPWANIRKNYSESVVEEVDRLFINLKTNTHGLILLSGPVGTGKSYLIRSIISEVLPERHPIICSPPRQFLVNMGLLEDVVSEFSKSLLIFEDIGELLELESVGDIDASSNLLNFGDGLMSLLTDCILIITFNHDLSKLNPALARPGRCIAQIAIDDLSFAHARSLLPSNLAQDLIEGNYSLAEVYEMLRTNKVIKSKKKAFGLARGG